MNTQMTTSEFVPPFVITEEIEDRVFQIRYLQDLNLVTVKGWSITSDIHNKYGQLLVDIQRHLNVNDTLEIHFKYELFNSSSAKYLFDIIKVFNNAKKEGKEVKMYWSCTSEHEDEMLETGIDLSGMCDFKFEITYS